MEAPLNKKVLRIQSALLPTWRDLASYLLLLMGIQISSQRIWAQYEPSETIQPRTDAEILKMNVEAGLPLVNVLRDRGWTAADLAELSDDMQAERIQQSTYASAVLDVQQRNFDQGNAV